MKEKKENILYVILSFLIVAIAYLINRNFRDGLLTIALSEALFWLSAPILFFSIFTLMTRRAVFFSWKKMTNYFFIISVIILLITPTSTYGLDFVPVVKETVTIALAILYSAISIILIIYKSITK